MPKKEKVSKDYVDVPLFSGKKLERGTEKRKPPPTAAWALCPLHVTDESADTAKRTGLVHVGEHLVWKVHYVRLAKSSIPCRASGSALCIVEPKDKLMRIYLPHDQRSTDTGMRHGLCPHEEKQERRNEVLAPVRPFG